MSVQPSSEIAIKHTSKVSSSLTLKLWEGLTSDEFSKFAKFQEYVSAFSEVLMYSTFWLDVVGSAGAK